MRRCMFMRLLHHPRPRCSTLCPCCVLRRTWSLATSPSMLAERARGLVVLCFKPVEGPSLEGTQEIPLPLSRVCVRRLYIDKRLRESKAYEEGLSFGTLPRSSMY
eukprot:15477586-Alexandrium_andersonii.AAC.1